MKINNYKHINSLDFISSESKYIYSKNIFLNQNLISIIEDFYKGKKSYNEFIKIDDLDIFPNIKSLKVIKINSLYEYKKNLLEGSKSLFYNLFLEIIRFNKYKNESLNTIQNLISTFDFLTEIPALEILKEELFNETNLDFEFTLAENLEVFLAESLVVSIFDNNENILKDEKIKNLDIKIIFIKLIEWISKYIDEDYFVIFDDIFLGLEKDEIISLQKLMNNIKNKIVVCSYMPFIEENNIKNLALILKDKTFDISKVLNDPTEYLYYLNENIDFDKFIIMFVEKMLLWSNIYGNEWFEYANLSKEENNFWISYYNRQI